MQVEHTVSAYDEDLRFLTQKISAMGGQAERMVERAIEALIRSDHKLAETVVADDIVLDKYVLAIS